MIDSIIRDVLRDSPNIEVIASSAIDQTDGYDVLILNAIDGDKRASGYNNASPSSGIVMVDSGGRTATVFRRSNDRLNLESTAPQALERAIMLAAGQG